MKPFIVALISLFLLGQCSGPAPSSTEILVVGGGASGVSAALQAARMGHSVLIVEPSPWLGGMLTSAGVSAIDGNDKLPSGIWGEFRDSLHLRYGGPENVATGWVSNTLFEPHVGKDILTNMVANEPNIEVIYGFYIDKIDKNDDTIVLVHFINKEGKTLTVKPELVIEATEYGDVLKRAGEKYSVGLEPKSETGESVSPDTLIPWSQDLTMVAILKEQTPSKDNIVAAPSSYDPSAFECLCREICEDNESLLECEKVLTYGKLPNNYYMINWPNKGNDTYLEILELSYSEREIALEKAKEKTLSWIHFMQTEAGFTHLALAKDIFPTEDHLALIPYIRESRRVNGMVRVNLNDILDPYSNEERPLFRHAIAVGDYPVDHHRRLNPVSMQIEFPKIPSYSLPLEALIPLKTKNLIIAEKSISVTSIVNGASRLQPVVLGIGQAAGALAGISLESNASPASVNVRHVQQALLNAHAWLLPYLDVSPKDVFFEAVQRVGTLGWMRGEGKAVAWANETHFYPNKALSNKDVSTFVTAFRPDHTYSTPKRWTMEETLSFLYGISNSLSTTKSFEEWKSSINVLPSLSSSKNKAISRADFAQLLDEIYTPYQTESKPKRL